MFYLTVIGAYSKKKKKQMQKKYDMKNDLKKLKIM